MIFIWPAITFIIAIGMSAVHPFNETIGIILFAAHGLNIIIQAAWIQKYIINKMNIEGIYG